MGLFNHALLLLSCTYSLLIMKGVISLPPARQQKFDLVINKHKKIWTILGYFLVAAYSYLIIKDLTQ